MAYWLLPYIVLLMIGPPNHTPQKAEQDRVFFTLALAYSSCHLAFWGLPMLETVLSLIVAGERKLNQNCDLSKSPPTCSPSSHRQEWKPLCLFVRWPGDLKRSSVSNLSHDVKMGLHPLAYSTLTPTGESFLFALKQPLATWTAFLPFMKQGVAVWFLSSLLGWKGELRAEKGSYCNLCLHWKF